MQKRWNRKRVLQSATGDRDGDDSIDSEDPPPSCHPKLSIQSLVYTRLKNSGKERTPGCRRLKNIRPLGQFVLFVPRADDKQSREWEH